MRKSLLLIKLRILPKLRHFNSGYSGFGAFVTVLASATVDGLLDKAVLDALCRATDVSMFAAMAPDDLRLTSLVVQWFVGVGALLVGITVFLRRVEP